MSCRNTGYPPEPTAGLGRSGERAAAPRIVGSPRGPGRPSRAAKNTPEKAGLFVTLWQRSADGPIRPFDADDDAELFLIRARTGGPRGHFVFRKEVLIERGIVSQSGIGGKRGFRVYLPWCSGLNAQARRTQLWQSACFLFDGASPAQIEGHYAC